MKKIINKLLIILIICAIILFVLYYFSAINHSFSFTTTKEVVNEVNENKDNIDEKLFTIVIPEEYFEYSGGSAMESVNTLTELGEEFCTTAEAKENDLIIEVTDIQRENLIKRNDEYADEIIEEFKNSNVNYDVNKSEDYKNLTIYADENFNTIKLVKVTLGVSSGCMLNNILEGNDEDWSVYLKIVNCNTGKTVAEGNVPQDTFSFGPEEWKASY